MAQYPNEKPTQRCLPTLCVVTIQLSDHILLSLAVMFCLILPKEDRLIPGRKAIGVPFLIAR